MFRKQGSAIGSLMKAVSPGGAVVAENQLRCIGANMADATSLTLDPWEPIKPGDLILVFAANTANTSAIATPSGFTLALDNAAGASRIAAFWAIVPSTGAAPAISLSGVSRISALIYRGAAGIGSTAALSATASTAHSVTLAVSIGSLAAAADVRADVTYALTNTDDAAVAGWCNPGNSIHGIKSAGTLLRPRVAGVGSLNLQFQMGSSTIQNMLGVEILPL